MEPSGLEFMAERLIEILYHLEAEHLRDNKSL